MKLKIIFQSFLLTVLICVNARADGSKETKNAEKIVGGTQLQKVEPEQWIDLIFENNGIVEQKKQISLTLQEALGIFQEEPPKLKADWSERLNQPIEPAENARQLPTYGKVRENSGRVFVYLAGFSKRFAQVMILKDKGIYINRGLSSCQANFKIPRDEKIDAIFGLKELERIYFICYKGIGNGNSPREVFDALGKPDKIQSFQIGGMLNYYYQKDDVTILFDDFIVSRVVLGVDESIKKKIKENGAGAEWPY